MRQDDLDRILSKEEEIIPSSGFAASVMDAVRREAAAPPPIPFPWKRAIPGLCAAGFVIVWVFVVAITLFIHGPATQPVPTELLTVFDSTIRGWNTLGANWIVLALAVSLVSVKLSFRFVSAKPL
jgi:hypothetical protein